MTPGCLGKDRSIDPLDPMPTLAPGATPGTDLNGGFVYMQPDEMPIKYSVLGGPEHTMTIKLPQPIGFVYPQSDLGGLHACYGDP